MRQPNERNVDDRRMNILFVHQNMPGQYRHLAPYLARDPRNRVVFITRKADVDLPNVRRVTYQPVRVAQPSTHHYLRLFENCVLHGQAVLRACITLAAEGFQPDVMVAHPGWGEALFLKDRFPRAKLLSYCEFFYHGRGADVGFDPEDAVDLDAICQARARNAHLLLSLEACDRGTSPTEWQRSVHPAVLRDKISVIFDGIDTTVVRPDIGASFALPDGRVLTAADEVVTYVARNLEPYRGFRSFIRALPELLRRRPEVQVLVAGGDEISYGFASPGGGTWRETMLGQVEGIDLSRVHFLGKIPYPRYLAMVQVSSLHIYLTVPFVLSWSCMEAMAAGCVVLASDTPPVTEVIEDGRNGYLVDFFASEAIAARAAEILADRERLHEIRKRARQTVLDRYALENCLPQQVRLVTSLA
jgi:glycosyltransferase involved in cell wall biosynthesis